MSLKIMLNKTIKFCLVFSLILFFNNTDANRYLCQDNKEISIPQDFKQLMYRTSNLVFDNTDLKTINKYVNQVLQEPNDEILKNHINYINNFKEIIENIQLPEKQLQLLYEYGEIMKKQNYINTKLLLDDIIWWSTIRMRLNSKDIIPYLNGQMLTNKKEYVIKVFIEKGMVNEIKFWSKKVKLRDYTHSTTNSKTVFNYAIRKATIINALNHNKIFKIIIPELTKSVDEILFHKNDIDLSMKYNHLKWLILHLGLYQSNPNIDQVLKNLLKDRFYYNRKKINELQPKERKFLLNYDLIHKFKGENSIMYNVKKALDPYHFLAQIKHNMCSN